MTQMVDVTLPGPAPWGFRLAGGKDFNTPIHISKTTPNGKAAYAGLQLKDVVCAINGKITSSMTHFEAQDVVREATGDLTLRIRRGGWVEAPVQSKAGMDFPSAPPPMRRAEPEVLPPPGPTATIVHKQFNSPVGLYSADNIADAFKGQVEGMGINAGATKFKMAPMSPMSPMSPTSPMSPGFGSQGGFGSSRPSYGSTPFGAAPHEPMYSKPKPMAQVYSGHAPRAQSYAPPRRPPPIVNRPKPQRQSPMEQRHEKVFTGHPTAKSRSFKMLEEMTQEEEARALEEMQAANRAASSASSYRSPADSYEDYDGRRGTQSRSFKMLQQMTAEEEAMMQDL